MVANLEDMDLKQEKTSATATAYLAAVTQLEFIVSLVISPRILHYARPATVKLQLKEMDILEGYNLVETLRNTIKHVLNEVDSKHNLWYGEAVALSQELNVEEKISRFAKRSIYRDNPPTESHSQYYRQALTITASNHLLTELDKSFN